MPIRTLVLMQIFLGKSFCFTFSLPNKKLRNPFFCSFSKIVFKYLTHKEFVQLCHFTLSEKCGFVDEPNCFTNCQFRCSSDGWNLYPNYYTFATITEGYLLIFIGKLHHDAPETFKM